MALPVLSSSLTTVLAFLPLFLEFLLLDFDGELALVELDGSGMNVITRARINEQPTWTPPTLIGRTLFFRDETRIAALDLSAARQKLVE